MCRRTSLWLGLVLGAWGLGACGPATPEEWGERLFQDPELLSSRSNVFACSTCHSVAPAADRLTAGGDLRGVLSRSSFWCGRYNYLLDGVNYCLGAFMRGDALGVEQAEGRALLAYLQALPAGGEPRGCTVVRDIDDAYLAFLPEGTRQRGEAVYGAACAVCHGELGSGKGRIAASASRVPDDTLATFGAEKAKLVIVEKIRHGKLFGIGGVMPPYTLEALSDPDLASLLLYVLP